MTTLLPIASLICGFVLLVWSADRFVDGAAAAARQMGVSPLLIGMVVIGFGTSAPELVVSALAAIQGNSGLALGNAYGSNIANIALVLGWAAVIRPITVHSRILQKELPILSAATLFAMLQLPDGLVSRVDAWILLGIFAFLMARSIRQGLQFREDALVTASEEQAKFVAKQLSPKESIFLLSTGLVFLIASSRLLVWGAVEVAGALGVSDIVIGLSVVAVGTSLPELASASLAVRKGEHDLAIGNVLGSNLFNTLAVVGLAGAIHPISLDAKILYRDCPLMIALTLSLIVFGCGLRKPGCINRWKGAALLSTYAIYIGWLIASVFSGTS